jgi:hypothetical protein
MFPEKFDVLLFVYSYMQKFVKNYTKALTRYYIFLIFFVLYVTNQKGIYFGIKLEHLCSPLAASLNRNAILDFSSHDGRESAGNARSVVDGGWLLGWSDQISNNGKGRVAIQDCRGLQPLARIQLS